MWAQQQGSAAGQNSSSSQTPAASSQPNSASQNSSSTGGSVPTETKPVKQPAPDLTPPRSDRVSAGDLGPDIGESSSKDTQIDLSPPADDAKKHPDSTDILTDVETGPSAGSNVAEFHPWNPHKAAKDIEVGDFYFKRKNYHGAEDRYREALFYKDNDAIATYRLAVCLEKLDRPDEAIEEYESYLKILPHGPEAAEVQKAIARLRAPATNAKKSK
jgi:tetratricopeptide (TPR) repeat protein